MIQMDGLGETEVVDVTMHMVAQERHFQDMNKTFWEFREKNMYTDLIFICQDGSIPAHSAVLARFFFQYEIGFIPEEEPQTVLFPDCSIDEILPALLETYASGSIEPWYTLLCTRNKPKLKRKRKPEQAPQLILLPQHKEEAKMMIKPDICGDEDMLEMELKDLEEEEEEEEEEEYSPKQKRRRKPRLNREMETDGKVFRCEVCHYSASSKTKLQLHNKAKHHRQNKYSCAQCEYQANKQNDMKIHLRTEHGIGGEGRRHHSCSHCQEFSTSNKKLLDQHIIEVHKNVRKYHCDQCNYSSNYLNNFQRHQKAHLGIPGNFQCSQCPKAFYVEAKLRSHMLVHSEDKNFVCEECAAKFKRKDDLKVHMKIHLPDDVRAIEREKKLTKVCETCGKKFEKNWKLKRHMVVHNKEPGLDKTAPRWQSTKGITIPEYIVLTADSKVLEEKFIVPDRISESKFIETGETKFMTSDGKFLSGERIVFNQIHFSDS